MLRLKVYNKWTYECYVGTRSIGQSDMSVCWMLTREIAAARLLSGFITTRGFDACSLYSNVVIPGYDAIWQPSDPVRSQTSIENFSYFVAWKGKEIIPFDHISLEPHACSGFQLNLSNWLRVDRKTWPDLSDNPKTGKWTGQLGRFERIYQSMPDQSGKWDPI